MDQAVGKGMGATAAGVEVEVAVAIPARVCRYLTSIVEIFKNSSSPDWETYCAGLWLGGVVAAAGAGWRW
jgi:hypothetical protein